MVCTLAINSDSYILKHSACQYVRSASISAIKEYPCIVAFRSSLVHEL